MHEEDTSVQCSGYEETDCGEAASHGCWGTMWGPLQNQQVLATTDSPAHFPGFPTQRKWRRELKAVEKLHILIVQKQQKNGVRNVESARGEAGFAEY